MKTFKRNNFIILILFIIVISMSVGFAVLSTTLNIKGDTNLKGQVWDIYFANIKISEGSVKANKEATIVNETDTLIEYEIVLEKPGDYYEFTVDAVNDGTLDAKIDSIVLSGIEGYEEYLIYDVTYDDRTNLGIDDKLLAENKAVYRIRIEYKKDIENPITNDTKLNLVFAITYSQVN